MRSIATLLLVICLGALVMAAFIGMANAGYPHVCEEPLDERPAWCDNSRENRSRVSRERPTRSSRSEQGEQGDGKGDPGPDGGEESGESCNR